MEGSVLHPMKKILSFDQASRTTGYAYFEDQELKEVSHFTCKEDDFGDRLAEFKKNILNLLEHYNPDEVFFEDIQLQRSTGKTQFSSTESVLTFKKLAEVFGVLYEILSEKEIPSEAIIPNVWKAHIKIAGKGRSAEKKAAQKWVFNTYGVNCTEDEADAVCIGSYKVKKEVSGFDWS